MPLSNRLEPQGTAWVWAPCSSNPCFSPPAEPFEDALRVPPAVPVGLPPAQLLASMEEQLRREPWYHGKMSRKEAEKLLKVNGDFLVRESTTTPGQYVLTGLQGGQPKHLLLVDPEGVVSQPWGHGAGLPSPVLQAWCSGEELIRAGSPEQSQATAQCYPAGLLGCQLGTGPAPHIPAPHGLLGSCM